MSLFRPQVALIGHWAIPPHSLMSMARNRNADVNLRKSAFNTLKFMGYLAPEDMDLLAKELNVSTT